MAQMFAKCGDTSSDPMIASFIFTTGSNTITFSEALASNMGTYTASTIYGFSQNHLVATNSALPTVMVHFCRDVGNLNTKREVWIYNGTLYAQPVVDLSAHTVVVSQSGTTLKTQNFDYHGNRRWWRWQEAGSRPIAVSAGQLISAHWVLPYDRSITSTLIDFGPVYGGTYTFPPSPMDTPGIARGMAATGERNDIGPLTDEQSSYVLRGTNWTNVMVQAEAAGAIPWHWIDDATRAPVNLYDHPSINSNPAFESTYSLSVSPTESGIPDDSATAASPWQLDGEHPPNTLTLAAMMTGDPYYVLMTQGQANWWQNSYGRWPVGGDYTIGPYLGFTVRNKAWRLRDVLMSWQLTPSGAPSWMLDKSYFTSLLNGIANQYNRTYITNPASSGISTFHIAQDDGAGIGVAEWQESFFAIMLYWWKILGAPSSSLIDTLFPWKADFNIAMSTGRDGFYKQWLDWYYIKPPAIFNSATNWGTLNSVALDLNGNPFLPPIGNDIQTEANASATLGYIWYGYAAMCCAMRYGINSGTTGYTYIKNQLESTHGTHTWGYGSKYALGINS